MNRLSISKEEFLIVYKGLPVCNYVDMFYTTPSSDIELLTKFLPSKLWRLNNLYTIVNKYGKRIPFIMNRAQHIVYAESLRHPRLLILKSRQQGISTFWLVSFFDDGITNKDLSIGLMAQGQDEASTLLDRTKILEEEINPTIKDFLHVGIKTNNTKEFKLNNGSNIFIRTSFRSTTLQRLHISEMGKIANNYPDKAAEVKTGTLQAVAQGNIAVIESTAEGDNMFKEMWDTAFTYTGDLSLKDFKPIFLSWLDDPDCNVAVDQVFEKSHMKYFAELLKQGFEISQTQKNFWVVQHRELGERVYQEYPATPEEAFKATKVGTYYADAYLDNVLKGNREVEYIKDDYGQFEKSQLYDDNLGVQLAIDLGMDDTFVITVFQWYNKQWRIIDEYYDSGEGIEYYCDWIKDQWWFSNLYHIILPHDANVKELGNAKKREEVFAEHLAVDKNGRPTNIYFTILEKTSVNEGIDAVRRVLANLWVCKKVSYLKKCLLNYSKEWDKVRLRWKNKPFHNEWSNGADSIRYMAVGGEQTNKMIRTLRHVIEEEKYSGTRGGSYGSSGGFDV